MKFKANIGNGTNNYVECVALRELLKLVIIKDVQHRAFFRGEL